MNCLFACNEAELQGGGVFASGSADTDLINCTIVDNQAAVSGGGITTLTSSVSTLTNGVLSGNQAPAGPQIDNFSATTLATYSLVEGGWTGAGNVDADPQFVDPDGADDDPGSCLDNDYRLSSGSPAVDAGNSAAVPSDAYDVDSDGDLTEATPDLDGQDRRVDDPDAPDGGAGPPPVVDMGAYERQVIVECPADVTGDGQVDVEDLVEVVLAWGACSGCPADVDGDGLVAVPDLVEVILNWGPC